MTGVLIWDQALPAVVGVHRFGERLFVWHPEEASGPGTETAPVEFQHLIDITEHPTTEGKVFLAAVVDAWSRRVVGWSTADHLRSELVIDALDMALWRRRPPAGLVHHSDHGTQYTSWAFGQRLRSAGILGSMGTIGDALDNAMVESFFGTLQIELLDRRRWNTRRGLAQAIFEYIEAWYNPRRRHSALDYHSPITYEHRHTLTEAVA